jgi:hypothetical protein
VLAAGEWRLPVAVTGGGTCPAPAEVEARLREILPVRPLDRPPRVASIEREAGGVRVIVREPEGAIVAERLLPAASNCTESAAAAALAIAAWETEGHSEFGALPPPVVVQAAPPPRPRDAFDVGVGGAGSFADSWRPAAVLRASWTPGGRGLGLGLGGSWEPDRESPLAVGRLHWTRAAFSLGPSLRWRGTYVALEGRAEAAVSFLSLRGQGFETDLTSLGVSPGAAAGARLLLPVAGWCATWLDAGGVWWLRRESAFTLPGADEASLPRWAVLVSLGLSVGRFR